MNDFDYDVLQKKRIARNAKYQKKGSRSKGCKLPGDYLTKAQKAKLSETKVSIKLRSPITLEEFMACSTPLKREWLEWVRDEFNAGGATISHDLWGKDRTWLIQYLKRHEPTLTDIFADHRRQKYDIRERWLAWCAGEQAEEKKCQRAGVTGARAGERNQPRVCADSGPRKSYLRRLHGKRDSGRGAGAAAHDVPGRPSRWDVHADLHLRGGRQ